MNVKSSKITNKGTVLLTITEADGNTIQKEFSSVRAGLSLPTSEQETYYIVLGQEYRGGTKYEGQPEEQGQILFLSDHQSQSIFFSHIVESLTDDASRYGFKEVYLDYSYETKRRLEEVTFLNKCVREKKLGFSLSFSTAPYFEDFAFGMNVLNIYLERGLLVLPEECLAIAQLRMLQKQDLAPGKGEEKFGSLNALRFVIGSFHKSPPLAGRGFQPKRERRPLNLARPRF